MYFEWDDWEDPELEFCEDTTSNYRGLDLTFEDELFWMV